MSLRRRRYQRWEKQPPAVAGIDWANALTRGLIFAYQPQSLGRDAVQGITASAVGANTPLTAGPEGVTANWAGASSLAFPTQNALLSPSLFTILAYARGNATQASYATLLAKPYGNALAPTFGMCANYGGAGINNIKLMIRSAGSLYSVGHVFSPGTTTPFIAVGTYDQVNLRLYQNGAQVASAAETVALQQGSGIIVSGYSSASVTGPWNGDIYLTAIWNRPLSAGEVFAVSRNPWQLFAPVGRRRAYSIPASGGASLAASASDATSAAGALTTAIQMAASATDATSATGVLTTAIQLAAAATDITTAAGQLSTQIQLAANAADATSASGLLTTQIALDAAASDATSATGALTTAIQLAAAALDTTSASGALVGSGGAALAANASDTTSASAVLTTAIQLGAPAADVTQATGALLTQILLGAHALDAVTAAANLSTQIALKGDGLDTTLASGILSTSIQLSAAAQDLSSATGSLQTAIQLAAAALDTITATATLGILAVLFADPDYTVVLRSRPFTATLPKRAFTVRLASRSFTVH